MGKKRKIAVARIIADRGCKGIGCRDCPVWPNECGGCLIPSNVKLDSNELKQAAKDWLAKHDIPKELNIDKWVFRVGYPVLFCDDAKNTVVDIIIYNNSADKIVRLQSFYYREIKHTFAGLLPYKRSLVGKPWAEAVEWYKARGYCQE